MMFDFQTHQNARRGVFAMKQFDQNARRGRFSMYVEGQNARHGRFLILELAEFPRKGANLSSQTDRNAGSGPFATLANRPERRLG